jgi:DUF1009 family protein
MQLKDIKKVGVIAGAGYLPYHVVESCKEQKIPYTVIGLEDETTFDLFKDNIHSFKVYAVTKIINKLKEEGVSHVVLAGKVRRADIARLLLDLKGAKLFAKIIKAGFADNNLLTVIIQFLEKEGFKIIAPEKLATDIVLSKGSLTKTKPDKASLEDIKAGMKILKGIAKFDVGQSLVIQSGLVLGVEAAEGTDELIKRCGEIKQAGHAPILLKISKPDQDKRVDLPCIGVDTIENAHQYGIQGIVAESGSTLVLDLENTLKLANKHKIFIYGM